MNKFDSYINSIIESLSIDKKQKGEMIEEFRDHLEMLKKENLNKGFSEDEAVENAIKCFGSENLKGILSQSINKNYLSISNILFGIVLALLIFRIVSYIPNPTGKNFYGLINSGNLILISIAVCLGIVNFSWISLPVGYFISLFFPRVSRTVSFMISGTIGMVLFIIAYISISSLRENVKVVLLGGMTVLVSSILFNILGYQLLRFFDSSLRDLRCRVFKNS